MNMIDIISKKRDNLTLTKEEIEFFINGYVSGLIPDYQASSLLMAIFLNGLNMDETFYLTYSMLHSGEIIDLSKSLTGRFLRLKCPSKAVFSWLVKRISISVP